MCGRYTLYTTDELEDRYRIEVSGAIKANYNVAPTQTMPVITSVGLQMMRWGLIPRWSKDDKLGYKLFNARSETVFEKPMWKSVIKNKRCLIPANGFYEWQKKDDGKQPFYIHLPEDEIFSMAGVWESWTHEGKELNTYSILTTQPNNEMENIHDRMPVILHKNDETQWLAADTEEDIKVLLEPYTNGILEMHEVGREVNTIKINEGFLVKPINSK